MGEVDIGQIEKELRELWTQMGKPGAASVEHPVTRACVLNLMIYAPGGRSEQEVSEVIAEIMRENPGRMIVMLPKPQAEPYLNAWVTAQCHLPSGGRKQICCEQIMVRAEGDAMEHLPSIVMPLLVPDLPTFLWWRDDVTDSDVFRELVETSDRVVIDSARFRMTERAVISRIAELIRENEWSAFSDLSWTRLTPWRFAIAEFYDLTDCRVHFASLDRIEIECPDEFRVRAMMLLGWLGSRLQWHPQNRSGDTAHLSAPHGPVEIAIRRSDRARITFRQKDTEFIVSHLDDGYLSSEVNLSGQKRTERVMHIPEEPEALLLSKELSIFGHDIIYEKALEFIANQEMI